MAKALIAVVLCTLLVAGLAADTGRNLLQDFNCNGAKEIGKIGNGCKMLCDCAAGLTKGMSKDKLESEKKRCMGQCESCKKEAETCKPGSGLPSACQEGQNNNEVKTCINTFLKSRGRKI